MRQQSVNLCLHQNVWQSHNKVVSSGLSSIVVQLIGERNDLNDFLQLLQFTSWCVVFLYASGFLDGKLPCMFHSVLDLDTKRLWWQSVQSLHLGLQLDLLLALCPVVEELRAEIVHDKVADLNHVVIHFFVSIQQLVSLDLLSCHCKQSLEQFLQS